MHIQFIHRIHATEEMMNEKSLNFRVNKRTLSDQHLASAPGTQRIRKALNERIWSRVNQPHEAAPAFVNDEHLNAITQVSYAWAAGFLDGEGCISLARVRRNCGNRLNYRVRMTIAQNCLSTLQTFRDYCGESCVLSQLPHRESYTRPIYQLVYDGVHAYRLLQKLRPFLIRKGEEADVIFEYYRTGEPTRHFGPKGVPSHIWHIRERCYDALRCLK